MTAGTTSSTPLPRIGDLLNYIFLFAHEAKDRDEGFKARPCMVVDVDSAERRVTVVPLTTQGERYAGTVAVPQDVTRIADLGYPTVAVIAETNSFTWVGFDLRPLVATGSNHIGRMPPGFTQKIVKAVVAAKDLDRD